MAKALSNTEKFAVQGMLQNNMELADIAAQINRPVDLVEKYVASIENSKKETKKNKNKAPKRLNAKDLMITTSPSGRKGIALMTPAASMKGDHDLGRGPDNHNPVLNPPVKSLEDRIHKINPEEN